MIKLDIQPYCESCCDFEPDVSKPIREVIYYDNAENDIVQTDTIIRCMHAKRCENIRRYLKRQSQGELNYD